MLDALDLSHPLFRDFKHIRLESELTLCYEAGTGGNFLIACLMDQYRLGTTAIDFPYASKVPLTLDTSLNYYTHGPIKIDYDMLYHMATGVEQDDVKSIFGGQHLPYITSLVFDFRTPPILALDAAPDQRWLPHWLLIFKNQFDNDYASKPWMISHVLQNNPYDGPLITEEYYTVCRTLEAAFPRLDLRDTPITWRYFCHCLHSKLSALDLENWSNFVFDMLTINEDYRFYDRRWSRYAAYQLSMSGYVVEKIDYVDLFFQLQLPKNSQLKNIDPLLISNYSKKNIEIIADIIELLLPSQQGIYQKRLDQIRGLSVGRLD